MKTKNFLRTFFTVTFVLGTLAINAQTQIYIHKSDGSSDEYNIAEIDSISFNPRQAVVDYSKLRLNEVSGVGDDSEKFYELINTGTVDINLDGCQIFYNANGSVGGAFPPTDDRLTWIGNDEQVIEAGKLFCLIGRNNLGSYTTGLTPERILIITLKDPDGNVIDQCIRAEDIGEYAVGRDKSFSRIPDGTGPFYFTTPTPCEMNGMDEEGLLSLPETQGTGPDLDYSKLKLNEISGAGNDDEKFYELINTGTEDIDLVGCQIFYNANGSTGGAFPPTDDRLTWTGGTSQVIEAGKLFTLMGRNKPGSFTTGLTPERILIITLKDPKGNVLDQFIRAKDTDVYAVGRDLSFSRIPDGTGPFYFTTPTPDEMNGADADGLLEVPETP